MKWLKTHAGKPMAARKRLGDATFKPIEPAPGSYVKAVPTDQPEAQAGNQR